MPIEQVRAFRTSNGKVFAVQHDANREEAKLQLYRLMARSTLQMGGDRDLWAEFMTLNASDIVEALTPLTIPHSPTGEG